MSTCVAEAVIGDTASDELSISTPEEVENSYRLFRNRIFTYALRRVPNYSRDNAEDVVQEVFINALGHVNSGGTISAAGFFFTTARNLINSMYYRGRKNLDVDTVSDFDRPNFCDEEFQAEDSVFIQQRIDQLVVILSKVSSKYQEAFIRRRVWGQSCPEIGEAMCISEQAASNYASLGWKEFQQLLSEEDLKEE